MAKYTSNKHEKQLIVKRFTDREEPRAIFEQTLSEAIRDKSGQIRVLDFNGIGGIGKTEFLNEMKKTLDDQFEDVKYIVMDFATVVDCGDVLEILKSMERMLREKYHFSFPFFDLVAYTYETKLGKLATRPDLDSIVENNQELGFMVSVMDEIPFVDTISKVIKLAGLAQKGKNIIKDRLMNRKLKEKLMEVDKKTAQEIKKELGFYFAQDLSQNTATLAKPLVIIFDTYEILVNEFSAGVPLDNDLFLRGAMGMIENSENVMWVISGREELKWTKFDKSWEGSLESHELKALSPEDAKWFLNEAGINDAALADGIYTITKGVPVYLDLCVDVYYAVKSEGREPVLDDFGKDTEVLVNRFCTYMNDQEKDFIMLLSFLDDWTDDTIEGIVKEKGGVFSPSLYEKIKDFSVISHENERYFVCNEVREVLMKNAPATIRKKFEKEQIKEAEVAVEVLATGKSQGFSNYEEEKELKTTIRESYNKLNKTTEESMETAILREYLAPDAMRIVGMVRKEPENPAVINLLKYFIRFHEPYNTDGRYTLNEWEEVRAVAEKVLPVGSIYLAKLYMDRPFDKEQREQYWLLSSEIIFRFETDEKAMLIETILTWLGNNYQFPAFSERSPYGIHCMSRIMNRFKTLENDVNDIYDEVLADAKVEDSFAKIRGEKMALKLAGIKKVVQTLRRNPDLLSARILRLMTLVCGPDLGNEAEAMLLSYVLEIEDVVNKTTDAELLVGYARTLFRFLGGEWNLPTEITRSAKMSRRAEEVLRNIRPRYEEVFGKDAEIVAEIICYTRKHQIHDGVAEINELLGDLAERFGLGTEVFANSLRLVSIEYYNEFSVKKEANDIYDPLKLIALREWTNKYLAVVDDKMIRNGFKEVEEEFGKKFPELMGEAGIKDGAKSEIIKKESAASEKTVKENAARLKRLQTIENSPARRALEAKALKLAEKERKGKHKKKGLFGLFGKK